VNQNVETEPKLLSKPIFPPLISPIRRENRQTSSGDGIPVFHVEFSSAIDHIDIMMMPKKVKFRKQQRGRRRGMATRGQKISFGEYGLQALEAGWVTARQIEAARIAMTRHIKRGGKIWIRIFPDKPVTKKPLETRMGKGKGAPEEWVCVIKPARVLYEIEGVDRQTAEEAFRLAAHKLPIKTRFVSREMLEVAE